VYCVCTQNPSDSELEDRITKIIAEEDEEIIRRHCFNYSSSHVSTAASTQHRSALTTHSLCYTTSMPSVSAVTDDIDDDELHQLLGVD